MNEQINIKQIFVYILSMCKSSRSVSFQKSRLFVIIITLVVCRFWCVCVCCAAPSDNWQPNMNVNINTGSTHLSLSRWNRWHRPCLQCKHYKTFFKRNESKGFFSSSVLVYFFRHHLSIKYAIERRNKNVILCIAFVWFILLYKWWIHVYSKLDIQTSTVRYIAFKSRKL